MRRELHERFMPDGSEPINKLKLRSITFIIHRLIHSDGVRWKPNNLRHRLFSGSDRYGIYGTTARPVEKNGI